MMVKRFKRLGAIALLASVAGCGVVQAADRGSAEDQMACTPDVYRLCSSYVPDEDAITACLRRNLRSLSPACHQVFSRPDTATPSQGGGDQDSD